MEDLLVAQMLWLLGQDDQWLRPRTGSMPVAVAAGALVDVVDAGLARWVDGEGGTSVQPVVGAVAHGLLEGWAALLRQAAPVAPMPVIHAINAVSPVIWDAVGADLSRTGHAHDVPRRVRRWLPPRRRPDHATTTRVRTHLRGVIDGTQTASVRDRGVLAVASCAGVLEHVLSPSAFTDHAVLGPARGFLDGSPLVARLTPAVSYLVSVGPSMGMGLTTGAMPGAGSGS